MQRTPIAICRRPERPVHLTRVRGKSPQRNRQSTPKKTICPLQPPTSHKIHDNPWDILGYPWDIFVEQNTPDNHLPGSHRGGNPLYLQLFYISAVYNNLFRGHTRTISTVVSVVV